LRRHLWKVWASTRIVAEDRHVPGTFKTWATLHQRLSGRKPDTRNRASVVAAAVEGECEKLVRTALQLAKTDNVVILKFLLGRLLPRKRLIKFEQAISTISGGSAQGLDGGFEGKGLGRSVHVLLPRAREWWS
jgi:hypothetical protein